MFFSHSLLTPLRKGQGEGGGKEEYVTVISIAVFLLAADQINRNGSLGRVFFYLY